MERNVCSLELAKKLKEAGWSKPTERWWQLVENPIHGNKWTLAPLYEHVTTIEELHAPTAQELADALPYNLDGVGMLYINKGQPKYVAYYGKTELAHAKRADTMADTLALLWLEVNRG